MRCSNCGAENPAGLKFCNECATPLARRCEKCGFENSSTAKFCGECATPLGERARAPSRESAAEQIKIEAEAGAGIEGERKTVTALFADIKGSTELMEELDPEAAQAIVEPALRIMAEAVGRYEGYLVRTTGDGIFALFGAPIAHEDHPQRGLYAALRLQEELKRYSGRLREAGNLPLEARVGVHSGELVAYSVETGGKVEYRLIGHTANLAARLEALAPTGSIAISEQTRKFVEGYFQLKPLGPTRVKGVSEPVNVFEVIGLGPLRTRLQRAVGRGLTRFVGREREMEALRHAAELAKSGRGQIVGAVAEPGVGKSRLFYEFQATSQSGWMVLETFSVSHGKASAYLPVIDLLRNYFRIVAEDDERTRREKVAGRITVLDRSLEDTLPYLFRLLGIAEGDDSLARMDGQVRKRRTLEAIKRIVLRESLNQPLMVIFEDLHWIDEQTQELLNLLADSIGTAKILLLVNYRPEYSHHWGNKTYYTQLRLDPLGRESAEEMLSSLMGDGKGLIPLKRLIVERTEGTPFFIEEMVQALFEDGALVRNGTVKLAKSMNAVKVPATVQAVLASRMDRLSGEEKELLQTLAVLGREFPLGMVHRVAARREDELERMLSRLQAAEFIYEQPATGDIEYIFKHALTQEVAYSSLLIERRKVLHELAAQALEVLFVDCIDDHLAAIAYQYSCSGNDTKAVEYLVRAGEQALHRSTFAEAARYFENGLARLEELPEDPERDRKEIAIRTGLADVTMVTSGYAAPEYERHLARRYELAERLGDCTQLFYSLAGVSVLFAFRQELTRAREIGEQILRLANEAHDSEMQLEAHGSLTNILWMMGDFNGVREHSHKGLALVAADEDLPYGKEHWRAACRFYGSACSVALGFPDQALRESLEFLAWAREREQPLSLVFALNSVLSVVAWRREGEEALKYADALLALTVEQGFSNWTSFAQVGRGQSLALLGRGDEAIVEVKSGISSLESTGAIVPGWMLCNLAFSYLVAMQPAEGLRAVARGLDLADTSGDAEAKVEIQRLNGDLLLLSDPSATAGAEVSFRAAVSTAREQHARLPELRATVSLARLLKAQGKIDEARAMLAAIYGWFTEGFDTADLRDARNLLTELSA